MNKKRLLTVDDESGSTRLLKLTLEKTGNYIVREENDGTNAWLVARDFRPDLVFLDIVMPKIDGGDVAQQIRSDPMLANVPIVFLTAIVSQKETRNEIGGVSFLPQPPGLDAVY